MTKNKSLQILNPFENLIKRRTYNHMIATKFSMHRFTYGQTGNSSRIYQLKAIVRSFILYVFRLTMMYVVVHYKLVIHDAGPRVGHHLFVFIPQSEQALRLR